MEEITLAVDKSKNLFILLGVFRYVVGVINIIGIGGKNIR